MLGAADKILGISNRGYSAPLLLCPNKKPDEIPLNKVVPPTSPPRNVHPEQLAPIAEVNFDFDLKKNFINLIFFTAATDGTGRGSSANSHGLQIC